MGRLLLAVLAATATTAVAGTATALGVVLSCTGTTKLSFPQKLNGVKTTVNTTGSLNKTHAFLKSADNSATGLTASGRFPVFGVSGTVTPKGTTDRRARSPRALNTAPLAG